MGSAQLPREEASGRVGLSLLATAWSALGSGRAESVCLLLRSGSLIEGVLAIRMDGAIAEAATRPGHFTHAFAVDEVVMVRQVPRGG
ncbi:hypothetical protein [Sandaracinobacter sp.]|uniref:hypothetical protein n=1 Tax=Sandaracinobacter sp. TaxID=2487581 RepID=UPI0035B4B7DB